MRRLVLVLDLGRSESFFYLLALDSIKKEVRSMSNNKETYEEGEEPVTFDSYGEEGQDPQDFIESKDGPPDAESDEE